MNLLDLYASLSLDSSGYDAGIASAGTKSKGLGAIGYAAGQLIADGFELAIQALGKLASSAINVGSEFEYSMAKVKTIMDPNQMGISDMEDGILSLSATMGIANTEIADTVYSVISATGDTAGALQITESAARLATAGFTDTSSAVGVLTIAMNAYHMSAEEVSQISDSLITVQNLGVTTVGELSNTMGKAIASGSAYGVSLDNIEAMYIGLTKAGIGSAEATTYMSSMMKELGTAGSGVSKVLEQQTGKSFSQLMAEGYDMSYVLDQLMQSCDGDTTAFMNLWSSAEAGKAASAIAGQGFEEFDSWLEQIRTSAGATDEAYATMAETFKQKTSILKQSANVVLTKIFERISPILSDITDSAIEFVQSLDFEAIGDRISAVIEAIRGFISRINWAGMAKAVSTAIGKAANAIAALYGYVKTFAMNIASKIDFSAIFAKLQEVIANVTDWITEHWETISTVLEVVGGAIGGIITALMAMKAISVIKNVISGVSSFFSLLAANPILLIVVAVAALVGALVILYKKCEPFRNFVNNMFGKIKAFAMPILSDLKATFLDLWETIKSVFAGTGESSGDLADSLGSIRESMVVVWDAVKPILTAFASFFVNKFAAKLKMGMEVIKNLFSLAAALIKGDWEGVRASLGGIVDAIKGYLTKNWDNAKAIFSAIWGAIREYVVAGWEAVVTTVIGWIDAIKALLSSGWETTKAVFSGVWQTLRGYVYNGWSVVKENFGLVVDGLKALLSGDWDTAKQKFSTLWSNLKGYVSNGWNTVTTTLTTTISTLKSTLTTGWEVTKLKFAGAWQILRGAVSTGWDVTKSTVTNALEAIYNAMPEGLQEAYTSLVTKLSGIKTSFTTTFTSIRTRISNIINTIKGYFSNLTLKIPSITWPHINTPHFSIKGSWDFTKWPPSSPSVVIDWYAKAMNNPMLLNGATIFGAMGGNLLGGGEAGAEVVSGADTLMSMMQSALADVVGDALTEQMSYISDQLAHYLPEIADRPIVLDSGAIVSGTARQMDRALGVIQARKTRGGT